MSGFGSAEGKAGEAGSCLSLRRVPRPAGPLAAVQGEAEAGLGAPQLAWLWSRVPRSAGLLAPPYPSLMTGLSVPVACTLLRHCL